MPIIDGHIDLGHNALEWNRDLRLSAHATRRLEAGMTRKGITDAVGLACRAHRARAMPRPKLA